MQIDPSIPDGGWGKLDVTVELTVGEDEYLHYGSSAAMLENLVHRLQAIGIPVGIMYSDNLLGNPVPVGLAATRGSFSKILNVKDNTTTFQWRSK